MAAIMCRSKSVNSESTPTRHILQFLLQINL